MSDKTIILYGVIFSEGAGARTEHSAHLTEEDAARAGADLARKIWSRDIEGEEFPEGEDDWIAMDIARGELNVRLEVQEIEISVDVLRAALARA